MTTPVNPRPWDLPDGRHWLRVADASWADPLDTSYAREHGGRWNPPNWGDTLYLSADWATARAQVVARADLSGFDLDDLADDAPYLLVTAVLPAGQRATDAQSAAGLAAIDLPTTYPDDGTGGLVPWERCQPVGPATVAAGLTGVLARSAVATAPDGRELAWYPKPGQLATAVSATPFALWRHSPPEARGGALG